MPTYPTLRITPDSEMDLATNGFNSEVGGSVVTDESGTPYTSANASAYVTVTNAASATVLSSTVMPYVSAGLWSYTTTASVFLTGAGPWTLKFELFDQTGSGGTKLRTWWKTGVEHA